jgi:hypothetical protein
MIERYPLNRNIVQAAVRADASITLVGAVLRSIAAAPVCLLSAFLHGYHPIAISPMYQLSAV